MSDVTIHTERCKACGFCVGQCPKKALSMTEATNNKGYTVVGINTEQCVRCGTCFWVCPDCVFELEG